MTEPIMYQVTQAELDNWIATVNNALDATVPYSAFRLDKANSRIYNLETGLKSIKWALDSLRNKQSHA